MTQATGPSSRNLCTIAGAVLADLSITSRIDTDLASLFVVDSAETGDPVLDSALKGHL
ncbi:MAG: GPP34 family phosphoprotein [Gammaproteobacteria bacterium]|nr:GPP34 family phosphoprotein [Gammaproteobacteria bacterium]